MAVKVRMTKKEFKLLPEGPPYYEFEYGEVIEMPKPHPWHNIVVGRLFDRLFEHVREHDLGLVFQDSEVDLTEDLTYAPDIIFLQKERATLYHPQTGAIVGTPDLVVEVISLTHQARDRITKFAEYERAGVAWLWLVDAFSLAVEEYQLEGGRYVRAAGVLKGEMFRPKLFSGLEIDLGALVGDPPTIG